MCLRYVDKGFDVEKAAEVGGVENLSSATRASALHVVDYCNERVNLYRNAI
jgi:hypothetical protein